MSPLSIHCVNLSKLTPLGRADSLVKKELEGLEEERLSDYNKAYADYRRVKALHVLVRILLYAGIITSVTATFGIRTDFIAKISSYIGLSVLFLAYAVLSYVNMVYREAFYVRREMLISSGT